MDAQQIRQLKPQLTRYLRRFEDCFARRDTRAHFPVYIQGQLSDLKRKSVEPIAKEAGVPPRTLQEFLSLLKWREDRMRDRLQRIVAVEHSHPHGVGIIDETSFGKQGDKTPGVQRQWCGSRGKNDNCVVTVHLGYSAEGFHCLLDGELFLPESWAADRERCREAGIPDDMVYRPKWQIALELYDRARDNGVHFPWLTFDTGYGGKPAFLRGLTDRQQRFVGEVPVTFTGWITRPQVTRRPFRRRRGRARKTPRLVSGSTPARSVEHLLCRHPAMRKQSWQRWRVRDGSQGPMVWETKHTLFYPKDEEGLPVGQPWHLVVARNVLDAEDIKYFLSNAPEETPVDTLLLVALSRWPIERCFEDQKQELGLDHYEGRKYPGLKRHVILTAVSHLFLARVHQQLGKKNPRVDRLPSAHGRGRTGAVLVA